MTVRRRFSAVDAVIVHLVRLVLEDGSDVRQAAARLRERADEPALRRAQARVLGTLAERPSMFAERASATLDLALASTGGQPGSLGARHGEPATPEAGSVR